MNQKIRQNYAALARSIGFRPSGNGEAFLGELGGLSFTIYPTNASYPYMLTAAASVQRPGGPLTKEECKQFSGSLKSVASLTQKGYVVSMTLKNIGNQGKLQQSLAEALRALADFLRASGFENCCQTCGRIGQADPCHVFGGYSYLCPDCFTSVQQNEMISSAQKAGKSENILGGIVGALLGSLLGVACIILLSQLGYVAALSGVVMAICTLKGYELLGGKLTTKGIVISSILMLVMTYVGDQLDWAVAIVRELDVDFITAFRAVPFLLQEGIIDAAAYWGNIVLLYLFLLLGAVPTVRSIMKNQKEGRQIYRLNQNSAEL